MGAAAPVAPAAPETTQAPVAAPAESTPTQAPAGDGSGAPAASPAPGAASPNIPGPRTIEYAKFAEARRRGSEIERQFQAEKQAWTAEQQRLNQQYEQASKDAQQLKEFREMLDEHPDIAEALIERVSKGTGQRFPRQGQRALAPQQPAPAALPADVMETIRRLDGYVKTQAQREHEATEKAQLAQVDTQLRGTLTGLLKEWNYPEEFLGDVRDFVIQKASMSREPVEIEDVPYLAGLWYRKQEAFHNKRIEQMRAGKLADQALPASPGATPGALTAAAQTDAFGDKTNQRLVEGLKAMGWGSNQGA